MDVTPNLEAQGPPQGLNAASPGDGHAGQDRNSNVLFLLLAAITAPIAAILIKAAISRSREYKADATGARMINKPWALASALEKLERGVVHRPIRGGNPASSHLFIVNPFKGGLAGLFSSHPPTGERVRRLREML